METIDIFANADISIKFQQCEFENDIYGMPSKGYELIPNIELQKIKNNINYALREYERQSEPKFLTIRHYFIFNGLWFENIMTFRHKPDFNFSDIENEVKKSFQQFLDDNLQTV